MSPGALSRELAGEEVILQLKTGLYFGLDAVGTRIWRLLGQGRTPDEIVASLREEYAVSEGRLRRDVGALLDRLESRGLIERA